MNNKLKIFLLIASTLFFLSCRQRYIEPSAKIVTKDFSFNNIKKINAISPGIIVYYTQGNDNSVRAEGPENMVKKLRIKKTVSNKLVAEIIRYERFNITSESQCIKILISSPEINSIEMMNGASVVAPEVIRSPKRLSIRAYNNSKAHFSGIVGRFVNIDSFQYSEISIDSIHATYIDAKPFNGSTIIINGDTINSD